MNSLYFDKMHMLYNQNKSCVKSCQNTLLKTNTHCFPKKPIVFQHVHFFIPLFWNEKLSLIPDNSFTLKLLAKYMYQMLNWECILNSAVICPKSNHCKNGVHFHCHSMKKKMWFTTPIDLKHFLKCTSYTFRIAKCVLF